MQERRQAARTRVLKAAQLFLGQSCTVIDCIVDDISMGGARLRIPSQPPLPKTFELSFDCFRSDRRCFVQWETEPYTGIAFR
jgi:PilZ domain